MGSYLISLDTGKNVNASARVLPLPAISSFEYFIPLGWSIFQSHQSTCFRVDIKFMKEIETIFFKKDLTVYKQALCVDFKPSERIYSPAEFTF